MLGTSIARWPIEEGLLYVFWTGSLDALFDLMGIDSVALEPAGTLSSEL